MDSEWITEVFGDRIWKYKEMERKPDCWGFDRIDYEPSRIGFEQILESVLSVAASQSDKYEFKLIGTHKSFGYRFVIVMEGARVAAEIRWFKTTYGWRFENEWISLHDEDLARTFYRYLKEAFEDIDLPAWINEQPLSKQKQLTEREIEVAQLLAIGYDDKQIAERLAIAVGTAKRHRQHIAKKWDMPTENIKAMQNEAKRRGYAKGT